MRATPAHALGGRDFHCENIIAAGSQPMIVDGEMVLSPLQSSSVATAADVAAQLLRDSVLGTGFLPRWSASNVDRRLVVDTSGIGARPPSGIKTETLRWVGIGTDLMSRDCQPEVIQPGPNVPRLNREPVFVDDYVADVLAGFRSTYRFLLLHRLKLLANDSPLKRFRGKRVRVLLRDTSEYWISIGYRRSPQHDEGISLPALSRRVCGATSVDLREVQRIEDRDLKQRDVPRFVATTDGRSLIGRPGHRFCRFFAGSALRHAAHRIRNLGHEDLRQQLDLIRVSLADETPPDDAPLDDRSALPRDGSRGLTSDDFLSEAEAIATSLRRLAVFSNGGEATWFTPVLASATRRFRVTSLNESLYDGNVGVALFLAALNRVAPANAVGARTLALSALQRLRRDLRSNRFAEIAVDQLGVGGATGVGSIVYGLTRIAEFLDEPSLIDDARHAAAVLSAERLARVNCLDVMNGVAGAILALAALQQATGEQSLLDRVTICAERLLDTRVHAAEAVVSRHHSTAVMNGFAHGISGIAYALFVVYRVTGLERFRVGAQRAAEHATVGFAGAQSTELVGWCNGEPGLALARSYALQVCPQLLPSGTATGACVLSRWTRGRFDQLCCGAMGVVDIALTLGTHAGRGDLIDAGNILASESVLSARKRGGWRLYFSLPSCVVVPGLFRGVSGIGYTLLRLARSGLPSLLAWE